MLKDWLVRRRENPYPNREEKKLLAVETGLTYTQICNWFANWRRKLKNSGNDPIRKTWGNLIKNYNTNARGNVEQFSICSNDSIW
ncbi:AGAP009986-PB, partial [Anopheles gambiae str. PEST]